MPKSNPPFRKAGYGPVPPPPPPQYPLHFMVQNDKEIATVVTMHHRINHSLRKQFAPRGRVERCKQ